MRALVPRRLPSFIVLPQLVMPQLLLDASLAVCVLFRTDQAVQMNVRRAEDLGNDVGAQKSGRAGEQNRPRLGLGLERPPARRRDVRGQLGLPSQERHTLLAPF